MVGAIFNSGLQLGSAIGLAVDSSIEAGVEKTHGGFTKYSGRAAVFWWLLSVVIVQALAVLIFYRDCEAETSDTCLRVDNSPEFDSCLDPSCTTSTLVFGSEVKPAEVKAAHGMV